LIVWIELPELNDRGAAHSFNVPFNKQKIEGINSGASFSIN